MYVILTEFVISEFKVVKYYMKVGNMRFAIQSAA